METGLSFYRGDIISYKRWQNSPAKHLDIKGHMGAVYSVKISKDLNFIVSCSADKSVRLFKTKSGKCLFMYTGHTKRVTDCDIHPSFEMDSRSPWIISCSGDKTIRMWNTYSEHCVKVLKGHHEAVYKCSFAPDGRRLVSCSEDCTVRTW